MRKRKMTTRENAMYVDALKLAEILSCGRNTADKIGKAAGARVKIGKSVRYSVSKVQQYLDTLRDPAA